MIAQNYVTVSGAYGRDYTSAGAAKADFLAGKDFAIRTPGFNSYATVADFAPGVTVNIRYSRDLKVAPCKVSSAATRATSASMRAKKLPAEPSEFERQLARNIRARISEFQHEGIVCMTLANLRQAVETPSGALPGAPVGTNAPWVYADLFQRVCMRDERINYFLIRE